MPQYEYSLANAEDDPALRETLAHNIMPGNISVSFRKEPSYFTACKVQGHTSQIIKCTTIDDKNIIGIGARFTSNAYINGVEKRIGYLADLRIDKNHRKNSVLAKGYAFLKSLHKADEVPLYTTMIWHDNDEAKQSLIGARAGLPTYRPMGKFLTPAIFLDLRKKPLKIQGVRFQKATQEDMANLFTFIRECHSKKQCAPAYHVEDLTNGRLKNLKPEDFYIAMKENEIVGTIAAWDQTGFRQTVIEGYSTKLTLLKPLYNLSTKILPLKPLQSKGSEIPYFYASMIAIKNNDVHIFRALLRHLYCKKNTQKWHYFICGLHENDPLAHVLKEYRRIDVAGELYCVYYQSNKHAPEELANSIPYIEAAAL